MYGIGEIGRVIDIMSLLGLLAISFTGVDSHMAYSTRAKDKVADYAVRPYAGQFKGKKNLVPFHAILDTLQTAHPSKDAYTRLVAAQEAHRDNHHIRDIRPIHLFRPDGTARESMGEIADAMRKYVSSFPHRFIRKSLRKARSALKSACG
jgi:hypothetical protein